MERILLAATLLAGLALAIALTRWLLERGRRRLVARLRDQPAETNGPARILYFTTPTCAECRLLQQPALRELEGRFGPSLVVETYDAIARADLAKRYRVRTVPTTAVFDAGGRLVEINYGFAPADRLAEQLAGGA